MLKQAVFALVSILVFQPAFTQPPTPSLAGIWQGNLKISGGIELRIVFHLQHNDAGDYTATMDSPDQGAKGIPVGKVAVQERQVHIEVPVIHGLYEGEVQTGDSTIVGKWSQGGMSFDLILQRTLQVDEPKRPQTPQPPFPYRAEDVGFENLADGIRLAGTLTIPERNGPFPAAILITGSGPQDRDETLLGHKPFLVLADYLTRQGIAVLRFDDRGVGASGGNFATATSEDFAQDVEAALDFLQSRTEIDTARIGLIGHSEGGLIAPMVAARNAAVAFIVLLAGPALPGENILELQSELIGRGMGFSERFLQFQRATAKQMYAILKTEPVDSIAKEKIRALHAAVWETLDDSLKAEYRQYGDPEKLLEAGLEQMLSPWFRFFLTYDPRPTLRQVRCPVLALYGERDMQVPAKENSKAIQTELSAGGNTRVTVLKLPRLNHLFQSCQTGLPAEYGKIEQTMAPEVLERIAHWILGLSQQSKN